MADGINQYRHKPDTDYHMAWAFVHAKSVVKTAKIAAVRHVRDQFPRFATAFNPIILDGFRPANREF